ncbi:MAG TPA: choice-of-anchor T family protein [Candidatus Thermoplasmatota archaeon]
MRRTLLALGLAWALVALALPATAAPGPPVPQVTVRLEDVPPVDVNRDSATEVVVNGTVNVTVPGFVEVSVALNVSVLNTYWGAVITPTRANLTGSGDVPFTATVTVPPRAGAEDGAAVEVVANVSAYGVGRDFLGQTPVPVIQFFALEVDPAVPKDSPATFSAEVGEETAFSFRLKNTGNGHDSFEVRVSNGAELQNLGITTELASPITNVGSGVTVVVSGTVDLPGGLDLADYPLAIEALSTGAVAEGMQAVAATQKLIHATEAAPPPDPGPGPNPGDGGSENRTDGGFLAGPGAAGAAGALAAGALAAVAWRRARRP